MRLRTTPEVDRLQSEVAALVVAAKLLPEEVPDEAGFLGFGKPVRNFDAAVPGAEDLIVGAAFPDGRLECRRPFRRRVADDDDAGKSENSHDSIQVDFYHVHLFLEKTTLKFSFDRFVTSFQLNCLSQADAVDLSIAKRLFCSRFNDFNFSRIIVPVSSNVQSYFFWRS